MRAFGLTDDLSGILSTLLAVLHLGGRVNGWTVQKWGIPKYGWIWSGKVMISHDKSSKMDQKVPAESVKINGVFGSTCHGQGTATCCWCSSYYYYSCSSDSWFFFMSLFLFLVLFFFLLLLFLLAVVVAVCMYSFFKGTYFGCIPIFRERTKNCVNFGAFLQVPFLLCLAKQWCLAWWCRLHLMHCDSWAVSMFVLGIPQNCRLNRTYRTNAKRLYNSMQCIITLILRWWL